MASKARINNHRTSFWNKDFKQNRKKKISSITILKILAYMICCWKQFLTAGKTNQSHTSMNKLQHHGIMLNIANACDCSQWQIQTVLRNFGAIYASSACWTRTEWTGDMGQGKWRVHFNIREPPRCRGQALFVLGFNTNVSLTK